jgi:hypothetical protein
MNLHFHLVGMRSTASPFIPLKFGTRVERVPTRFSACRHWWSAAVLSRSTPNSSKTPDIHGAHSTFGAAAGEDTRAPVFGRLAFERGPNQSVSCRTAAAFSIAALFFIVASLQAEPISPDSLRLVPFPKTVQVADGGLKLKGKLVIQVVATAPANQAAFDLQRELSNRAKGDFAITTTAGKGGQPLLLWLGAKNTLRDQVLRAIGSTPEQEEGYALMVTD